MFTGLVDAVGTIDRLATTAAGRELRIRAPYEGLEDGESIAVNGACMTVREHGADDAGGWFTIAAVWTSLGRTAMGDWGTGRRVNLERAMRLGDRFGGHLVLGHVDGVGRVRSVRQEGDARLVDVALPEGLDALMVPHGSLTVDGVSLTVNALPAPDVVQLSLIEYTLRHTALDQLQDGDTVHVEADVLGKHVARLLARGIPELARGVPAPAA